MAKIKLDQHDIFNKGRSIEDELNRVISDAVEKKIALVEIVPGKGSGQMKKRVLRFLGRSIGIFKSTGLAGILSLWTA